MTLNDKTLGAFRSPDLSPFVVHLVGRTTSGNPEVPGDIRSMSPAERVRSILDGAMIEAFPVYGSGLSIVCLTECTPGGLEALITRGQYEPWGLGFSKVDIYEQGGGPAYYVRDEEWNQVQRSTPEIRARAVRLSPSLLFEGDGAPPGGSNYSNWTHEREWRALGPIDLKAAVPRFAIVPSDEMPTGGLDVPVVEFDRARNAFPDPQLLASYIGRTAESPTPSEVETVEDLMDAIGKLGNAVDRVVSLPAPERQQMLAELRDRGKRLRFSVMDLKGTESYPSYWNAIDPLMTRIDVLIGNWRQAPSIGPEGDRWNPRRGRYPYEI